MDEKTELLLPKNVKQIGTVNARQRVYIEDYVITYLRQQLSEKKEWKVSALLGKKQQIGGQAVWFINGAVAITPDFFMDKLIFDEEGWQEMKNTAEKYFPKLEILGWAISCEEAMQCQMEQVVRTHKNYFEAGQNVYFEHLLDEKEENVYLFEKGKMSCLTGFYIYYERNEEMQNYMVSLRKPDFAKRIEEEEKVDTVAKKFREVSLEKKGEMKKRKSSAVITFACLLLATVIMVIGITLLNNYEQMQNMQQMLTQISGKIGNNDVADNNQEKALEADDLERQAQMTFSQKEENIDELDKEQLLEENQEPQQQNSVLGDEEIGGEGQGKQLAEQSVGITGGEKNDGENSQEQELENQELGERESEKKEPEGENAEEVTAKEDGGASNENELLGDGTTPGGENENENASLQAENSENSQNIEDDFNNAIDEPNQGDANSNVTEASSVSYTIQKGDTLAGICLARYGSLEKLNQICEMNHIQDQNTILYGKKILLPE